MLYYSWDMVRDRCNYFSLWVIFYHFTSLTAQRIKILKKWKKYLEISSLYTSVPKIIIICYSVLEIWRMIDVIIFHFGLFFALLTAQKIKILNKWKKHLEMSSFYICVPKIMIRWCMVPEIWCAMERWTDGQTEKVTYRGGCPT